MSEIENLTFELYNQEVRVHFRQGSEGYRKFGRSIDGMLTGRTLRERMEKGHAILSFTGIFLKTERGEIHIAGGEIEHLERATYRA